LKDGGAKLQGLKP